MRCEIDRNKWSMVCKGLVSGHCIWHVVVCHKLRHIIEALIGDGVYDASKTLTVASNAVSVICPTAPHPRWRIGRTYYVYKITQFSAPLSNLPFIHRWYIGGCGKRRSHGNIVLDTL